MNLHDDSCADYVDPTIRKCPIDYFECGAPSRFEVVNLPGSTAQCSACTGLSSGPCQDSQGICYDYWDAATATCPYWTQECTCPTCYTGSGPCHADDGSCHDYAIQSTQECPADMFECGRPEGNPGNVPVNPPGQLCLPCFGLSNGPCQNKDTVCYPYSINGQNQCPHGSSECVCPTCVGGSGPCRNIHTGECTGYQFGITCPLDTISHVGIVHVTPVVVSALLARLVVPPLIRW